MNLQIAGGAINFIFKKFYPNYIELIDSTLHLQQEANVKNKKYSVTANLFVKKEVMNELGFFYTKTPSGSDKEFCQRAYTKGFEIHYLPNAIIYHPARDTYPSLFNKLVRIRQGQVQLKKIGIKKNKFNEHNYYPFKSLISLLGRINYKDAFVVFFLISIFIIRI